MCDNGWRSIDSAPKDGTDILVCEAGRQGVEMVAWKGGEKRGGWHTEDGSTSYGDGIFTHWQPLPTPLEGGEQP